MNEEHCSHKEKLCTCALGVAIGLTWGLGLFLIGILAKVYAWGVPFVNIMGSVYLGYTTSWQGIFTGLGWGFVDGFVCGFIVAFIYNLCVKYCNFSCHK